MDQSHFNNRNIVSNFFRGVFSEIKSHLFGLPSFCRLSIYELLEYCDYASGVISIGTLEEIVHNDFYVAPSPGRKKETINSDTIRNALRTIKKARPEHFKFSTKNQRITIEMPFLRDLYQQFYGERALVTAEVSTDLAGATNHTGIEKTSHFESEVAADIATDRAVASCLSMHDLEFNSEIFRKSAQVAAVNVTDVATPKTHTSFDKNPNLKHAFFEENARDLAAATYRPIKDINKINNNNNNSLKLPIAENFIPSPETIARANALGLDNVTDFLEIQAFIDHNKAIGSLWADYNPIYLRWLTKSAERKQQQKLSQSHAGRTNYADSKPRQARKPHVSARERVKQAYASQFDFNEETGCFEQRASLGA